MEGQKIIKKKIFFNFLVLFILIVPLVLAIPPIPHAVYGEVKVNNVAVPDGTIISAWINGVEYVSTTTTNSNYEFDIPGDDTDTPDEKEGGCLPPGCSDEVSFYINSLEASQTIIFRENLDSTTNLDLSYGSTSSTDSAGSTGGGGGTTTTTTVISFTTAGVNVSLRTNDIAKFAFDRAYHTIKITKIGTDYVTLEIASDPVTITLKLLGSRKLDLNNDNYYDLYVKLNEIKSSKAYLTVKYIHEIIPVVPAAEEEEDDTKITTPPKIGVPNESIIIPSTENDSINKSASNETRKGKKITYNYLFYLGIIIITVIIIILYIKKWKK